MDSRDSLEMVVIRETLDSLEDLDVRDLLVLLDLLVHRGIRAHREVQDCRVCKELEVLLVFREMLEELAGQVPPDW